MVCISCIVIPVVLYIWHKFLQPLMLRFWNPWGSVEAGSGSKPSPAASEPLKCPFSGRGGAVDGVTAGAGEKTEVPPAACPASGHAEHVKGD